MQRLAGEYAVFCRVLSASTLGAAVLFGARTTYFPSALTSCLTHRYLLLSMPADVALLRQQCLAADPSDRPTFDALTLQLQPHVRWAGAVVGSVLRAAVLANVC